MTPLFFGSWLQTQSMSVFFCQVLHFLSHAVVDAGLLLGSWRSNKVYQKIRIPKPHKIPDRNLEASGRRMRDGNCKRVGVRFSLRNWTLHGMAESAATEIAA